MQEEIVSGFRSKVLLVVLAIIAPLAAGAVENGRLITFAGQPAMPASASGGTVSNANGSMTVTPVGGDPANYNIAFVSYQTWTAAVPGKYAGTTYLVSPSATTVPYRLSVADLRVSSTVYISARCLNPTTLALEACDLGDRTQFPRTDYPPSGGWYTATATAAWDSAGQRLQVTTPSLNGSLNTQSNGFYLDLPPYVREITYWATNSSTSDYIAGSVWVADAPSVSKTVAPASVKPGQHATLTITLKNPALGSPVPGVNLTDDLPQPLQLVSATHTCTGGTLTAAAGTGHIELKGATIPTAGCTITAEVLWPDTAAGVQACQSTPHVTNSITPPAQFSTAIGQMNTVATAPLHCDYVPPVTPEPPAAPAPVPTLGEWALWLLASAVAWLGWRRGRAGV